MLLRLAGMVIQYEYKTVQKERKTISEIREKLKKGTVDRCQLSFRAERESMDL